MSFVHRQSFSTPFTHSCAPFTGMSKVFRRLCASATDGLRLFRGVPDSRQQRAAATIREALASTFSRGMVRDRRLENGAAIHVVDVEVAKGGTVARVLWEPMDERRHGDEKSLTTLQRALEQRSGILRAYVNSYLKQKSAVALEFVPLQLANSRTKRASAFARSQKAALQAIRQELTQRKAKAEDSDAKLEVAEFLR